MRFETRFFAITNICNLSRVSEHCILEMRSLTYRVCDEEGMRYRKTFRRLSQFGGRKGTISCRYSFQHHRTGIIVPILLHLAKGNPMGRCYGNITEPG